MDRAAAKAEMTEDGRSERLLITEEEGRDVSEAVGGGDVTEQIAGGPSALRRDDGQVGEGVNAGEPSKQRAGPEGGQEAGGRRRTGEEDGADRRGRTENKGEDGQSGDVKERGQPPEEEEEKRESAAAGNGAGAKEDVASTSGRRLDADGRAPSEEPDRETPRQLEAGEQAHRLTPEFPEALYELLCTLQEGRRLNDQRCSFRLEAGMRRRRCHSEPNTSKPTQRVFFSSTTSLQREEFFELVAAAQARRLNDQRAELQTSPPRRTKAKSFRGSIRQLSIMRRAPPAPAPAPAPVPAPKEELYDMILTTQAQGRLEDQRSRAPGPMDDEDFFSLLLRVQGGRMEEQRTELPHILQT